MAQDNKGKDVDLSKILLPKKEGPSKDSAQRVNAAVLLEQEQKAAAEGVPVTSTKPADSGYGNLPAGKLPEVASSSLGKPPPSAVSSPKKEEESTVKPLETYRGAIEQAVQQKNVSVVSIAAAEAKRRGEMPLGGEKTQAQAPSAPQDLGFTIAAVAGGALLIAAAAVVLVFVFSQPRISSPVADIPQSPFIAVDDVQVITIDPVEWQRSVIMEETEAARRSTALSLGLVARLYVALASTSNALPAPATVGNFLAALAPNVPDELIRSLSGEFLLGVHSFDGNQAFLILDVESYEAGYAGMLEWEWTMQQELTPLFARTPRPRIPEENIVRIEPVPVLPYGSSTVSTTTSATTTASTTPPTVVVPDFFKSKFVDRVVENHDARVIQDENNDILLLWSFLDRETLVITTNEYTLREIISRRSRPPTITL